MKDRLNQMARIINNAETRAANAARAESRGEAGMGAFGEPADAGSGSGSGVGKAGAGAGARFAAPGSTGAGVSESDPGAEDQGNQVLTVRRFDQIRADSLIDMLLASDLTQFAAKQAISAETITARAQVFTPRARVEVTSNETVLQDLHDRQVPAAGLAGYDPIDTETARLLAEIAASWDVPEVNPDTGDVITVDTYRPSAAQRKFLTARDLHCRFPECRVPIRKCDLDHTVTAADDGETSTRNLAGLCRLHHTKKRHPVASHPRSDW